MKNFFRSKLTQMLNPPEESITTDASAPPPAPTPAHPTAVACPELTPELAQIIKWSPQPNPDYSGELASRYNATAGAHKWLHYFDIYEELFSPLRTRPISLLEIGVYQGASAQVWRSYFHKDSVIVGIDIDPTCARFDNPVNNQHIRIGPQQDPDFLQSIVREFGPFDLIIDDGSHIPGHMIASFTNLFGSGLKPGGLYFVEDTHSNYWPTHTDHGRTFMSFCYSLIDCMHAHYQLNVGEHLFRVEGDSAIPYAEVPKITSSLQQVRFWDSIVVLQKSKNKNLPQSRHW